MTWSLGICKSLSHIAFQDRRALRAESWLLLSLDPTQHLFNTCLDPHVVQPYLKFAVTCHEDCCTCLQCSSLVCHSTLCVQGEVRVCFRFPSKVYSRVCSSNQWHLLVERASVRPHHKSCAVFSVSVCCIFGFASFSRLKLTCSRSVPPLSSPISSLNLLRRSLLHKLHPLSCVSHATRDEFLASLEEQRRLCES